MNKKPLAIISLLFALSISRLVMSPAIQSIRAVDISLIFGAGMLAGALLVGVFSHLRAES